MKRKLDEHFQIVSSNTAIADKRYCGMSRKWEHHARTLTLSRSPLHIDIEVTNACNLKCSMCERTKMDRKVGYMDYGLFCAIIDQCAIFKIPSVKLNLWGESLLHKDIFRMIKYAKAKNIYTQFNTNATFVKGRIARRLINSGLDRITFSVESIERDIYEDTRRGAKFETTMANIENFAKLKPIGKKPFLTVQCIRMKRNYKYIPAYVDKFKDKADFVSVTNISSIDSDAQILKESMIDYKVLPKMPCPELWRRLSVFWNGDVTACCEDYNGFLTFGNIRDNSLKELWHTRSLNELRKRHKRLDFSGLICEICTTNHRVGR